MPAEEKPTPTVTEALETLRYQGQSAVSTLEPVDCRALHRLVQYLTDALADVRRERAQLQHQLTYLTVEIDTDAGTCVVVETER